MGGTSRVEMDQVSASQVLLADLRKLSGFVVAKWVLFSDDKKSTRISNLQCATKSVLSIIDNWPEIYRNSNE